MMMVDQQVIVLVFCHSEFALLTEEVYINHNMMLVIPEIVNIYTEFNFKDSLYMFLFLMKSCV